MTRETQWGVSFFEKFRRCKFATFCSYSHVFNKEEKLKLEVKRLNKEVLTLHMKNNDMLDKLEELTSEHSIVNMETIENKECVESPNNP